jgi:FKBP-type peptidyl-prolyl cis-trans isomerase FkpA
MRSTSILLLCVSLLVAVSCEDRSIAISPETQLAMDIEKIDQYLADNNIVAETHASGLRYVIVNQGSGEAPGPDKCVRVNYKLWFLGEPTIIEEASNFATALSSGMVLGWRIGLKEIQKGGRIMLYVPSGLGYGRTSTKQGTVTIPANQVLIFDVEVTNITDYNSTGGYCYPWPQ